jgi:hypothetical protein
MRLFRKLKIENHLTCAFLTCFILSLLYLENEAKTTYIDYESELEEWKKDL